MSKLSKFVIIMAVVVLAVITTMSVKVNAATNADVIGYVNNIHNINGMVFELSNDQKQAVIDYLTANPVDNATADAIMADIKAGEAEVAATGATNIKQINADVRASVIAKVKAAGQKAGLVIDINTGAKTVTVKVAKTGATLFTSSYEGKVTTMVGTAGTGAAAAAAANAANGTTLLYTGQNYAIYALPVLAIIAVAVLVKKCA